MQFPITSYQMVAAVGTYGYRPDEATSIVNDLVTEGRISMSGSMLNIRNPSDPDSHMLAGLCREARGGTAGYVSRYKIREYLDQVLRRTLVHGGSRRH